MNISVQFLGAAQTVTGSKYLLEIDDFRLLIDCGLFQGLRKLRRRNWDSFPVPPEQIDAVVLTHAHLDHSGYLPRLYASGYRGKTHCTDATADLLEVLLLDSAKLQMEEADFAKKKGYSRHENPKPLYDTDDVEKMLPHLVTHPFDAWYEIHPQVRIRHHYAGHILGASGVEVQVTGDQQTKSLYFTGDIGRVDDMILYDPRGPEYTDVLFIESTYGDRSNINPDVLDELATVINETIQKGGSLMIPAFSVGRTQNILLYLKKLWDDTRIPHIPLFMDSPMAIAATEIYIRNSDVHKISPTEMLSDNSFLTLQKNLHIVRENRESRALNERTEPCIILSASGMLSGGRIMHHLFHRLPLENDTLLLTGFQAEGTRGRKILEGDATVSLFGMDVPVKCRVYNLEGLSAHADREELTDWLNRFSDRPKMTFVVHGEEKASKALAGYIDKTLHWNVTVPDYMERYPLFEGI